MTPSGRSRTLSLLAVAVATVPPALATAGCASTRNQAAPPSPTVSASSAQPSAAAPCRTGELKASLGVGGVAAGRWAALLEFTNLGPAACTMTGWPVLAGVTDAGAATPAVNRSDSMDGLNATGVPRLTLAPGGKAGVDVSGADNAAQGGICPQPYRGLRVSAPGDPVTMTVPAAVAALGGGLPSCAGLTASPVHPLSDFSFSGQ